MRKRANFVLSQAALLVGCGSLFLPGLVGCGSNASGASDEYRAFSETKDHTREDQLPVINPGKPGHSEIPNEPNVAGGGPTDPAPQDPAAPQDNGGTAVAPAAHEESTSVAGSESGDNEVSVSEPEPEGTPTLTETGTRDEVVLTARKPKLLVAEHSFVRDRETKALRVTYDDIDLLRILNMEPVPTNAADHFPRWLKKLNGKQIRIRGFMYPAYKATGLTSFGLARDNGICCFVREAKIYDLFPVQMAEGQTTDYIQNRPFDVVGTFHIDPLVEDNELFRLYRIDNARVIDK